MTFWIFLYRLFCPTARDPRSYYKKNADGQIHWGLINRSALVLLRTVLFFKVLYDTVVSYILCVCGYATWV